MDGYITVAAPAFAEYVEKRSRFLGEIRPVDSEESFAAFLSEIRLKYRDARHHCSAFLLRGGAVQRYSDDGEPQGTAGMPILEILRREGLENCGIVITRYFGGTLLGAGGLIRAYAHTAKLTVDAAERAEVCRCADFLLECPYPFYDRLSLLLREFRAVVLETGFAADVTLEARMRAGDWKPFSDKLTELTGGTVLPIRTGESFASMPAGEILRETRL